jgi:hypothetical protein
MKIMCLKLIKPGVTLLAIVLLAIIFQAPKAFSDAQLATSVMASAGGEGSSTNFRMRSTMGQSTPIGSSASTNFEVGAGFWYQDPVAPSAIGDLTVTLAVSDIVLQWSHAGDNVAIDHYVVYRATDPVFVPSGGNAIGQTEGASYQDAGVAGVMGTDHFYLVKAIDPAGNLAEESNRAGEFDKEVLNAAP